MSRNNPTKPTTFKLPANSQEMMLRGVADIEHLTTHIIIHPQLPALITEKELVCLVHIMLLQWHYKRRAFHITEIVGAMHRHERSVTRSIAKIKASGLMIEEGGMRDGRHTYELAPLFAHVSRQDEKQGGGGR